MLNQQLIDYVRKTVPQQIAEELVSVQPLHKEFPELYQAFCARIAQLEAEQQKKLNTTP